MASAEAAALVSGTAWAMAGFSKCAKRGDSGAGRRLQHRGYAAASETPGEREPEAAGAIGRQLFEP